MIIECPNCGFSGRVPAHVISAPHHARCPKCRFGFDIGDLAARSAEAPEPWDGFARAESSASSSSYEIETVGDAWEDEETPARPKPTPSPPPAPPAAPAPPATREPAMIWGPRLFEGWAIAQLAWAALIGLRAVYATLFRGDDLVFSQALFWPVAAVVLLVSSASGLFLALGLVRKLADGHADPVNASFPSNDREAASSAKRTHLAKAERKFG